MNKNEVFVLSTIDNILYLAKQKGIKQVYICNQLGLDTTWLRTVKKQNINISPERLAQIADILGTTVEYLNGETDNPEKEKSPSSIDELSDFKKSILELLDMIPEDEQENVRARIEFELKLKGLLK